MSRVREKIIAYFWIVFAIFIPAMSFAGTREVTLGRYYQTAGSDELSPLEWKVLAEESDRLLLITKYCVNELPYNETRTNVTWETCTLRHWLNNEFLMSVFNSEERTAIIQAESDKVFLLSRSEVQSFMPNESDRQCSPTDYAQNNGVYMNNRGLCAWWTRSQGSAPNQAVYLSSSGAFGRGGHYVDDRVIAVRPSVWVKKNFFAENFLYSVKPTQQKAFEAENQILPLMKQEKPFEVKELHDYFLANPEQALKEFDRKRFEASGTVLRTGPDGVFGEPCIELSDSMNGKC